MRRRGLGLLAAALGALLAGCNDVYSERPLFGAPVREGGALQTGVWLALDPGCQFDQTLPIRRWPKCADWILVRPGQMLRLTGLKAPAWEAFGYAVGQGEPLILQIDASGLMHVPEFRYAALEPERLGPGGQAIEVRAWQVNCGPPPPTPPPGRRPKRALPPGLTLTLLPGLEPAPDADHAQDCRARDADAVRRAAEASLGWSTVSIWRWVRGEEQ